MSSPVRQEEALLMLLQQRRLYEPTVVGRGLGGPPAVRRLLAETLGRVEDSRRVEALLVLLRDEDAEVRRRAAFALRGQRDRVVLSALALAAADADRRTGELALRSLARSGAGVERLVDAVVELEPEERFARLAAAVFELSAEERVLLARLGLELDGAERSWRWALALAHEPTAEVLADLRALLDHEQAGVRRAAAVGLGDTGDASDLAGLARRFDDEEAAVVAAALEASAAIIARGAAAPPAPWRDPLLRLAAEAEPGRLDVRVAARRLLRFWAPRQEVADALAKMFDDRAAGLWERGAALEALLRAGSPLGIDRLGDAVLSEVVGERRLAAAGLGVTPWPEPALPGVARLVERLLEDADAAVRLFSLRSLFELRGRLGDEQVRSLAAPAWRDASAEVRVELLRQLEQAPIEPMERLLGASGSNPSLLRRARDERVRRALVGALAARAASERLERGALVAVLEEAAEDSSPRVRERAAHALERLGRPAPAPRPWPGGDSAGGARELLERTDGERHLVIETERGPIGITLECERARRSCLSLLQLAELGFYDGTTIGDRRPGLDVRAGDPTGTGLGDAGYRLADELTPEEFLEPGVLYLVREYPHGAGSRFALTLGPQPWRGGREIAFGRVSSGFEILAELQPSDTIRRVRVVAGTAGFGASR